MWIVPLATAVVVGILTGVLLALLNRRGFRATNTSGFITSYFLAWGLQEIGVPAFADSMVAVGFALVAGVVSLGVQALVILILGGPEEREEEP